MRLGQHRLPFFAVRGVLLCHTKDHHADLRAFCDSGAHAALRWISTINLFSPVLISGLSRIVVFWVGAALSAKAKNYANLALAKSDGTRLPIILDRGQFDWLQCVRLGKHTRLLALCWHYCCRQRVLHNLLRRLNHTPPGSTADMECNRRPFLAVRRGRFITPMPRPYPGVTVRQSLACSWEI